MYPCSTATPYFHLINTTMTAFGIQSRTPKRYVYYLDPRVLCDFRSHYVSRNQLAQNSMQLKCRTSSSLSAPSLLVWLGLLVTGIWSFYLWLTFRKAKGKETLIFLTALMLIIFVDMLTLIFAWPMLSNDLSLIPLSQMASSSQRSSLLMMSHANITSILNHGSPQTSFIYQKWLHLSAYSSRRSILMATKRTANINSPLITLKALGADMEKELRYLGLNQSSLEEAQDRWTTAINMIPWTISIMTGIGPRFKDLVCNLYYHFVEWI